ncbi:hypothetical protein JOB18_025792 [Solea senegalensis]|uniref:Uncharacterized protein n=1 Tax=Solea senegalensis TaxID=28829 RepID=A0AAV6T7I8_SOLSE|nr:hypothetical protein JOB18_025792 [Solea senegalensis]
MHDDMPEKNGISYHTVAIGGRITVVLVRSVTNQFKLPSEKQHGKWGESASAVPLPLSYLWTIQRHMISYNAPFGERGSKKRVETPRRREQSTAVLAMIERIQNSNENEERRSETDVLLFGESSVHVHTGERSHLIQRRCCANKIQARIPELENGSSRSSFHIRFATTLMGHDVEMCQSSVANNQCKCCWIS